MERSRDRIGAIPAPPPTKTSAASESRNVKTPNGPVSSRRSPTWSSLSRKRENSPSGYTLMTNSSSPSRLEVFAIENDRTWSVPGTRDVHVLAGEELDLARFDEAEHQVAHVVRHRVLGHHLGGGLLDRQAGADHVLVVVEQLDRDVLVRVRPAQQGVAFLLLVVGQRERGIAVELDVFAVEYERLARGALAFLAAVHEHDSLLGRGPQDRLVLVDVNLDADGLEVHLVLLCHCLPPGAPPGRPRPPATGGAVPERQRTVRLTGFWSLSVLLPPRPSSSRRGRGGRRGLGGCSRRRMPCARHRSSG